MKKCHGCTKQATLHITELRDGEARAIHFCESCAKDYLNQEDNPELSQSPAGALQQKLEEYPDDEELAELDATVCPNCGISFAQFRSKGRLGCPHDYVAFEDELLPLLENIHGETQHVGKVPRRAPDGSQRQYRLIKLRNELRAAIEQEAYETAAGLRDEIQSLENDLGQDTAD